MRQCANCGGPFGMVRHYIHRIIGGPLQFCSRWCKEEYQRKREIGRRQLARAGTLDRRLLSSRHASG